MEARRVSMMEGYRQGLPRQLRLVADGLEPVNGFSGRAGTVASLAAIRCRARPALDRLQTPEGRELAETFALAIRPLPGEGASRLLLTLSLSPATGELAAELMVPRGVFETLLADWRAGLAARIELAAATDLWAPAVEAGLPEERQIAWRLGPQQPGDGGAEAKGLVETIAWSPASPDPAPAAMSAAMSAVSEDETGAEGVEMLGRIALNLRLGLVLLVFLILVIALE